MKNKSLYIFYSIFTLKVKITFLSEKRRGNCNNAATVYMLEK